MTQHGLFAIITYSESSAAQHVSEDLKVVLTSMDEPYCPRPDISQIPIL